MTAAAVRIFLRTNALRTGLITAAIVAVFVASFRWGIAGEPYVRAQEFIRSNEIVRAELGEVQSVGLSWWHFSLAFKNSVGLARLRCPVDGARGRGIVYLDLERRTGVWSVAKANLTLADERVILK